MPRDIQMPTVAKPGRPGTRPAGPRSPILGRRPCSVFTTRTRAVDASWNTQGACSERESYLLILERYRPMGNQTRRAWLGCGRMCGLYVWHSLPLFVGVIPVPRPASHGPVRRDSGAETTLKLWGRGTQKT